MIKKLFTLSLFFTIVYSYDVSHYTIHQEHYLCHNEPFVALRSFEENHHLTFWGVNPITLTTSLYRQEECQKTQLTQGRYFSLLRSKQGISLYNSGIRHLHTQRIALSADLCPSSKKIEKEFFVSLKDAPIALCVSGKWILSHQEELNFLQKLPLRITWVNHSYAHPYKKSLPDTKNFFLTPQFHAIDDILHNEKILLEHNIIPSIFFRFPGLISQPKLYEEVTKLGLVVIGSGAWVAKGETIHKGDIVLLHGNGNEPLGIEYFQAWQRSHSLPFSSLEEGLRND